jgi:hypothetical protein
MKTITGVLLAAALALAACGSTHSTATQKPRPCIDVQKITAEMQTDMHNAGNGVAIPRGASWPTKTADLAGNPQYDASNPSAVNSLYWDKQAEDLSNYLRNSLLPAC